MRPPVTEMTEQPGDPLGGASGAKRLFQARFLGKANEPDFPFTIANEIVASFLGATLGLRVPHAFVYGEGDAALVLIQMSDRDPSMQEGPPATARAISEFVAEHPDEVHGAVIFDLFVANNDRAFGPHRRNLLLDEQGCLVLYDHGNACYYRRRPSIGIEPGIPRLDAVADSLEALGDMDHKGNAYREFPTQWDLVDKWCTRIEKLPDYVIDAAIDRIPPDLTSPTTEERAALRTFLLERRSRLREQIIDTPSFFPKLPPHSEIS